VGSIPTEGNPAGLHFTRGAKVWENRARRVEMTYNPSMTVCEEILEMKDRFAAEHGGKQPNVLYVSDPKWRQWWGELARIGNPHVDNKLSVAIGRKGFAAMRGQVWNGMRVERLNPNERPEYRTFVAHETAPPEPVVATVLNDA
jgi:hypothetical protein